VRDGRVEFGEGRQPPLLELVGEKPPIVVMKSSALAGGSGLGGSVRARAAYRACTSAIEYAFSSGVWCPGRLPIRMTWLWQSMSPGTAIRPSRLTVRGRSLNCRCAAPRLLPM
jgi:hypothetical protein